jgi:hypothetical protein
VWSLVDLMESVAPSPGVGEPARRLFLVLERGLEHRLGARMNGPDGNFYERLHYLAAGTRVRGTDSPLHQPVPRFAVCRTCHIVFARRRDVRVKACSTACRKKRMPTLPEGQWAWVRVGGTRFAATPEDIGDRQVETGCEACDRLYWRRDDSHRFCDDCASGRARTARYRAERRS